MKEIVKIPADINQYACWIPGSTWQVAGSALAVPFLYTMEPNQIGYTLGKSITDEIYKARKIIKQYKTHKWNVSLNTKIAFNNVWWTEILEELGKTKYPKFCSI